MDNFPGFSATDCEYCKSKDIYIVQLRKNLNLKKPIYKCLSCKKRFTPNDGFRKFRHPPAVIETALELLKQDSSLAQVAYHLNQNFRVKISRKTILDWKKKFIKK